MTMDEKNNQPGQKAKDQTIQPNQVASVKPDHALYYGKNKKSHAWIWLL